MDLKHVRTLAEACHGGTTNAVLHLYPSAPDSDRRSFVPAEREGGARPISLGTRVPPRVWHYSRTSALDPWRPAFANSTAL